jgi:hypothetical protein
MSRAVLSPPIEAVREQIVIAPHHPDSLRRPSPCLGAIEPDHFRQTLLWNVFRTFELLSPAFWLRRLQARLHMDPVPGAPHIVRVDLWRALGLPLTHQVDGAWGSSRISPVTTMLESRSSNGTFGRGTVCSFDRTLGATRCPTSAASGRRVGPILPRYYATANALMS